MLHEKCTPLQTCALCTGLNGIIAPVCYAYQGWPLQPWLFAAFSAIMLSLAVLIWRGRLWAGLVASAGYGAAAAYLTTAGIGSSWSVAFIAAMVLVTGWRSLPFEAEAVSIRDVSND